MEQSGSGKALAIISALISAAAAFFTFTVPAGAWNSSAEGASLLTGAVGGAVGAGLGAMSKRSASSLFNTIGLWLGVAVFATAVAMLLLGSYGVEYG